MTEDSDASDAEMSLRDVNSSASQSSATIITPNSSATSPPYSPVKIVGKSGYLEPSQQNFIQKPKTMTKKMKFMFSDEAHHQEGEGQREKSSAPVRWRRDRQNEGVITEGYQHNYGAAERHDSNRYKSSHSISELLKKDTGPKSSPEIEYKSSPDVNDKQSIPGPYNVTNIYMLGSNIVSKTPPFFDADPRRHTYSDHREFYNDDIPVRSSAFDSMPASVVEFSYRNLHQHHEMARPQAFTRRAATPVMSTGITYHGHQMSTGSHSDSRQRSKYTCRSAGSTPLSSPGPFLEKSSFFNERMVYRAASELEGMAEESEACFGNRSTPSSPSKSFLKKQRDDGMER